MGFRDLLLTPPLSREGSRPRDRVLRRLAAAAGSAVGPRPAHGLPRPPVRRRPREPARPVRLLRELAGHPTRCLRKDVGRAERRRDGRSVRSLRVARAAPRGAGRHVREALGRRRGRRRRVRLHALAQLPAVRGPVGLPRRAPRRSRRWAALQADCSRRGGLLRTGVARLLRHDRGRMARGGRAVRGPQAGAPRGRRRRKHRRLPRVPQGPRQVPAADALQVRARDGRAQPDVRLRAVRAGSAAHPRVQERGRPARGEDARCAQGGAGRGGGDGGSTSGSAAR